MMSLMNILYNHVKVSIRINNHMTLQGYNNDMSMTVIQISVLWNLPPLITVSCLIRHTWLIRCLCQPWFNTYHTGWRASLKNSFPTPPSELYTKILLSLNSITYFIKLNFVWYYNREIHICWEHVQHARSLLSITCSQIKNIILTPRT